MHETSISRGRAAYFWFLESGVQIEPAAMNLPNSEPVRFKVAYEGFFSPEKP